MNHLIYPEQLRKSLIPPLCELKHLKIEVKFEDLNVTELVDGLLWLAPHLETVSLIEQRVGPDIISIVKVRTFVLPTVLFRLYSFVFTI